jgi:formate hydrogenlyase subunit 3/multisubunit Na+/H+ antiporter MnhD subunit
VLVKAALFLTFGALAMRGARLSHATLLLAAILALSLAGLPLTGGALAKLALKAQFAGGLAAVLATISSIGTALLMTHFLICLAVPPPGAAQECPASLVRYWDGPAALPVREAGSGQRRQGARHVSAIQQQRNRRDRHRYW